MTRQDLFLLAGIVFGVFIIREGIVTGSSAHYLDVIRKIRKEKYPDVEEALVLAVIETESSFDPDAVRLEPAIADASYGLMQLLGSTASWLGLSGSPEQLYDPETNIFYGMKLLNWLQEQFPGNLEAVIMSYNEGAGNYRKGKRVYTYYGRVYPRLLKWRGILEVGEGA